MADVFISYSDKSPDAAEVIADELERAADGAFPKWTTVTRRKAQ